MNDKVIGLDVMVESYIDAIIHTEGLTHYFEEYAFQYRAAKDCEDFLRDIEGLEHNLSFEQIGHTFVSSRFEYGLGFLEYSAEECKDHDKMDYIAYRFSPLRREAQ